MSHGIYFVAFPLWLFFLPWRGIRGAGWLTLGHSECGHNLLLAILFSESVIRTREICFHLILTVFAAIDVFVIGINLVICSQGCIPKKISLVALHGIEAYSIFYNSFKNSRLYPITATQEWRIGLLWQKKSIFFIYFLQSLNLSLFYFYRFKILLACSGISEHPSNEHLCQFVSVNMCDYSSLPSTTPSRLLASPRRISRNPSFVKNSKRWRSVGCTSQNTPWEPVRIKKKKKKNCH